jgi:hypothetical protein
MFPVSLDCFENKQNKNNPEKLETWGTQDEDKQKKSNPENMVT